MSKELLLVYEPAQAARVEPRANQTVVALDYEVELDLVKRGIPFVSLATVAPSPRGDRDVLEHTRMLARRWYTSPEMRFFQYDGIKLGEQHEVVVLYYIQSVVYWTAVLERVLEAHPDARLVSVFETHTFVPPTADPTAAFKEGAVVAVAELLAKRRGLTFVVIPAPAISKGLGQAGVWMIALSQRIAWALSFVWNASMSLRRPRPIRLFATDPWARLEPFIGGMQDVELFMSRRQEMRTMLPGAAWRTRARFNHRLDFVDAKTRRLARACAKDIARQWDGLGEPAVAKECTYNGIVYWPVVRQALDAIVRVHAEDAIATIMSTQKLFAHYRVNCVLLFASTKGYNNLVARVAERMDIPSIELQHALVNNEKTLVHCRLNSRYLASYGPLINRMYESWGIAPERLIAVGSPRFDRYAAAPAEVESLRQRLGVASPTVLHIVPQIYLTLEYGNYTSYEVQEAAEALAQAQKRLSFNVLLRPKLGLRQHYYEREETRRTFSGKAQLVLHEDLHDLLALSDIVVTGTSTVVLEAMLAHKPVLLYVPNRLDEDFSAFWEAGAVALARTPEELLARLQELMDPAIQAETVKRADDFVQKSFLLDGRSAGRVAALVRRIAGTLEGERLQLEPLRMRHISDEYASWFSDPETTRYNRHGSGISRAEMEAYVRRVEHSDSEAAFAVIVKDGGAHIGNISLQKIDHNSRSAEFAILLGNKEYRGKGFAAEASKLLLRWGFEQLGLERIYCGTPVQHTDMRNLAHRLGFAEAGVRKGAMQKGGELWDVIDYALRKDDLPI